MGKFVQIGNKKVGKTSLIKELYKLINYAHEKDDVVIIDINPYITMETYIVSIEPPTSSTAIPPRYLSMAKSEATLWKLTIKCKSTDGHILPAASTKSAIAQPNTKAYPN